MEKISFEQIKSYEVEIIDYVARVCKENNLKYYLAYGTLLGAVRHKGFIPWDDDVDILMPRADYMKFIQITSKEQDGVYKCFSVFGDDDYFYPFIKVSDKRTVLQEKHFKKITGLGVSVDIFPLDFYDGSKSLKRSIKRNFYKFILSASLRFEKSGKAWRNLPKRILFGIYKNKNAKKYSLKIENLSMKFTKDTGLYFVGQSGEEFKAEWFGEGVRLEFEGKTYNCPSNYDEVLKAMYGDYMTLPPESERVPHGSEIYKI